VVEIRFYGGWDKRRATGFDKKGREKMHNDRIASARAEGKRAAVARNQGDESRARFHYENLSRILNITDQGWRQDVRKAYAEGYKEEMGS